MARPPLHTWEVSLWPVQDNLAALLSLGCIRIGLKLNPLAAALYDPTFASQSQKKAFFQTLAVNCSKTGHFRDQTVF